MNKLKEALKNEARKVAEWFDENAPDLFSGRLPPGTHLAEETYQRPKYSSLNEALKAESEKIKERIHEDEIAQTGGNDGVSEIDFSKLFTLKKVSKKYKKNFVWRNWYAGNRGLS